MKKKDIAQLEKLSDFASPEKWEVEEDENGSIHINAVDGDVVCARICTMDGLDIETEQNDAAFIVAIRNAMPELLAALRKNQVVIS